MGTPLFVYSKQNLAQNWQAFKKPLGQHPHTLCYAVKANSNIAILQQLAQWGAGFDVVSIGELERARIAGADTSKIIFAGVGKQRHEIQRALELNIQCFSVESVRELEQIDQIAQAMGKKAPIALRLNPDIDANTHPYIATGMKNNKFGIPIQDAVAIYQQAKQMPGIDIRGIACHIGSQLTELQPFLDAFQSLLDVVDALAQHNITLQHIDIGGGLGVRYHDETPPTPQAYIESLLKLLGDRKLGLVLEPGRAIVADAGILLCRVILTKAQSGKQFAVVDAAMNDIIRPALYQAWHDIMPVQPSTEPNKTYDIVGPICESGDWLGKDRELAISEGDVLAIRNVGAYVSCMSSQYNARPRAAELLIDGDQVHLIRERERIPDLSRHERLI